MWCQSREIVDIVITMSILNGIMNTTLQVRTSKQRKEKARKVFERIGLNLSSGVNLYLEKVITTQSVPFVPVTSEGLKLRHWKIYRKEIEETLRGGKGYKTAQEMHADILKD